MAKPLCIVIVDDEESEREGLRRLLTAAGMRAHAFASGAEFLARVSELRADCLIIDMHMPGLSGLEVVMRVRSGPRPLPTVVISGKYEGDVRRNVLALGATAFLTKPVDADELLDALKQAVARPPSV